MALAERTKRRSVSWLAVLAVFVVLLVLSNTFTDGERFYGVAPIVVIALAMLSLFGVHRATSESVSWEIRNHHIAVMAFGAALYIAMTYFFEMILNLSIGPLVIKPQICLPIILGYAFGPVAGFFSGSVGSLLGDFVTGWGVFPAWHIGAGLTGLMPGLAAVLTRNEASKPPRISILVIAMIAVTVSIIFVHPTAPEPWTGEVRNFSFWAWALVIGGVVMIGNSVVLQDTHVDLAGLNLWGTLGILVGNGFAALAHLWLYEYSLATAVIGEFAPAAATDILNLVVFTPLVLAAYQTARRRGGLRGRTGGRR